MEYTVTVSAPHAESGEMKREMTTQSAQELAGFILGLINDHPDTPLTFAITARRIFV